MIKISNLFFGLINLIVHVFKLGNSIVRYIYDTHHLNIICIILYFDMIPFFQALLSLQHICYYFNQPTPYVTSV